MGVRAHVQTKRVIEYGDIAYCNNNSEPLLEWLRECGVVVNCFSDGNSSCEDWEIQREDLRGIKDEEYAKLPEGLRAEVKEMVSDLINVDNESDWVYLSWW